ncbi:hypothetical protein A2U01_0075299, partial [Trifolium medium]|nr:hypothetical protein [Trifolium medium]
VVVVAGQGLVNAIPSAPARQSTAVGPRFSGTGGGCRRLSGGRW